MSEQIEITVGRMLMAPDDLAVIERQARRMKLRPQALLDAALREGIENLLQRIEESEEYGDEVTLYGNV